MNELSVVPEVVPLTVRDKVSIIEQEMFKHEQLDLPVKHYFSHGVYARELSIPKGTMLTGKIHRYQQINILSKGEISVLTEDGMVRVQAPFTVVSPPGTKRLAYAHDDCVWTTILPTSETDPDKIEQLFTSESEADYADFLEQTKPKELI